MPRLLRALPFLLLPLAACGDDERGGGDSPDAEIPDPPDGEEPDAAPPGERYEFASRFDSTMSSVAYGGQVSRMTFIYEMSRYISQVDTAVTNGANHPNDQLITDLGVYWDYDASTSSEVDLLLAADIPTLMQQTMGDMSPAKLIEKIAGNDMDGTMYKDWSTGLVGWAGATSPAGLVQQWIAQLDDLAASYNPNPPESPSGVAIEHFYVTTQGQDLRELLQKFLLGAIALSQGADDYLDDATEGKGILSPNTRSGDALYTSLEHAWDEGFGYFGASRDYGNLTDETVAGATPYSDYSGDNLIDLRSEYNTGASVNAAKRDLGAATAAATDFTQEAWDAFLDGRQLIADAGETLTTAELDQLRAYRDAAVAAWEKAIAASAVHYINDVLQDMNAGDSYDFETHAKHWSELKGFALSFQFNPRSPFVTDAAAFVQLHTYLGTAPVLLDAPDAQITAYEQALRDARALIGTKFGFDAANLGDDNGENGW